MPKRSRVKKVTVSWTTKDGQVKTKDRWLARYRDPDGKQRKKYFDRQVDGERWLDEITTDMVTGRYVDPSAGKITLQKFYEDFKGRQIWEASSEDNADRAVGCCTFKDKPLKDVRKSDVEAWVKEMTKTLVPATIHTRFIIVQSVLRGAVSDKRIAENPAEGVTLPKKPKQKDTMKIPTAEQVGKIIANADQRNRKSTRVGYEAYVALCAFAGLRKGEALGIQVRDIDFAERTLRVDRQIQRAQKKDIEQPKKNTVLVKSHKGILVKVCPPKYDSYRTIAIPDELIEILLAHIALHTPEGAADRWLFTDEEDLPHNDNSLNWKWRGACNAAGVTGFGLHDLRHFYASGLIHAGCDVVTVQNALGHASATTTLNTYAHLWPNANDRTRTAAASLAQSALATGHILGTKGSKQTASSQQDQHARVA